LLKGTSTPDERLFGSTLDVMAASVRRGLQELPWETGAAITFVVLEALHHHQPWHAGILAAGLAVYLLAVHQAESAVPKSALEGQGPLLGAGLAMVVVVTAVATVPFARQGALAEWMEIVAALAVMAVGALVVPL
jgi:hypothetical protein